MPPLNFQEAGTSWSFTQTIGVLTYALADIQLARLENTRTTIFAFPSCTCMTLSMVAFNELMVISSSHKTLSLTKSCLYKYPASPVLRVSRMSNFTLTRLPGATEISVSMA